MKFIHCLPRIRLTPIPIIVFVSHPIRRRSSSFLWNASPIHKYRYSRMKHMDVTMEKRTAEELITYKLRRIQKLARKILRRWNEISADNFLAKQGDATHKN